ncbi:hypothetical protein FKM82_014648 [Ascaphus truei]
MCPAYTLLLLSVLSVQEVKALQCFSCVGSSDEDCNRQGSQHCPKDSDACAIIRGQTSEYKLVGVPSQADSKAVL